MVFSMSPDRPLLVRLASEWFFRAGSRSGPAGRHPPQRKQHCSPPPEKQIKEETLIIYIGTGSGENILRCENGRGQHVARDIIRAFGLFVILSSAFPIRCHNTASFLAFNIFWH
ncbi:hypothetical protein Hanom_Chr03g00185561 [Helianthus anomalus]